MIGYRTKKHQAFGWAAARLDDLVNLIPARLTGLMYVLLARAPVHALTVMVKDAPWPSLSQCGLARVGRCVCARHPPVRAAPL